MLKKITEKITYVENGVLPLSSDVIIIKGDTANYVFDVGANDESFAEIDKLQNENKPVVVFISHFHADHMSNLKRIKYDELYVTKNTSRYCSETNAVVHVIDEEVEINDGVQIKVMPIPSSHAKGCLCISVDDEYLFVGDALYPMNKNEQRLYNVQHLKEQIDFLVKMKTSKVFLSHDKKAIIDKEIMTAFLNSVYVKREKNNPYIYQNK